MPAGVEEPVEALLAAGDAEAALETVFRELAGISDDELRALKEQPAWPARVAAAPALPRELRATAETALDAAEAAEITAPTLLITGAESTDPSTADLDVVAAALRDARVVVLPGQGHVADVVAPETFARHLLAFLRDAESR